MKLIDIFKPLQKLNEHPVLIDRTKFNFLLDETENTQRAKDILEDGTLKYEKEGFAIYDDSGYVVMIDISVPRIIYYNSKEPDYDDMLDRDYVRQGALWRDKKYPITKGLPRDVFWNLLLPEYHTIVTDWNQTEDGKRFWIERIKESFSKENCYVYFVSSDPELIIKITNQNMLHELNMKYKIWSDSLSSESKRIFITTLQTNEILEE